MLQHVQLQCAIPIVPGHCAADGRLPAALPDAVALSHSRLGNQQVHQKAPQASQHPQQRSLGLSVSRSRRRAIGNYVSRFISLRQNGLTRNPDLI